MHPVVRRPARWLLSSGGRWPAVDRLRIWTWDAYARLAARRAPRRGAEPRATPLASVAGPDAIASRFTRHLTDEVLPFWMTHGVDRDLGGFFNEIDRRGRVVDAGVRHGAMQARMMLSFCLAHEVVPREEYAALARHGLAFLISAFWDTERGGWRDRIDTNGRPPGAGKHLFTNAYALLALAEYARILGTPEPLAYAVQTYDLLDRHAWDASYAGYYERCAADWSPACTDKTVCIHLDMLAAVMALAAVTSDARHAQRAEYLTELLRDRLWSPRHGCVLERFRRDWTYQPLPTRNQVWTGHNLKAACLLLEMAHRVGRPWYADLARTLVDFCLREGWDEAHGGFYQHVYRTGGLARDEKLWWPQCEGLQALWMLHEVSGEPIYLERFHRLAAFALSSFPDPEFGEWVTACRPDGTVSDWRKAHAYKTAYHPARMCHALVTDAAASRPDSRPGRPPVTESREPDGSTRSA